MGLAAAEKNRDQQSSEATTVLRVGRTVVRT